MSIYRRLLLLFLRVVEKIREEETAADPFGDTIVIDAEDAQSAEDEVYVPEEDEELASAIEILDAEIDDTVDPSKLDLNENLPDHVVNILLVGIDGRTEDMGDKNSTQHGDVQIIVSINKETGEIKMTSILRDLYVTIPGYKSKNRINVAYQRGGGELPEQPAPAGSA